MYTNNQNESDEAQKRWGQTQAYKIAAQRTQSYTPTDWKRIKLEARAIYQGFQQSQTLSLADDEVKRWVDAWQHHIDQYYYPCDNQMLCHLADLYEQDLRYAKNIDKVGGEGTAQRMIEAIRHYHSN